MIFILGDLVGISAIVKRIPMLNILCKVKPSMRAFPKCKPKGFTIVKNKMNITMNPKHTLHIVKDVGMKDHFIHPSHRPFVQPICPVMVYLLQQGGENSGVQTWGMLTYYQQFLPASC